MMCKNVAKAEVSFVTTMLTNWQGCRAAWPVAAQAQQQVKKPIVGTRAASYKPGKA
jgi:hypothetical protein